MKLIALISLNFVLCAFSAHAGDPVTDVVECVNKAFKAAEKIALLEGDVVSAVVDRNASRLHRGSTQGTFFVNVNITKKNGSQSKVDYLVKTYDEEVSIKPIVLEYCMIDSINKIR